MTSERSETIRDIALVAAAMAVICIPLMATTPLIGDERYHFPLVVRFMSGFPVFAPDYSSAYTPLPYIVTGTLLHLTGPSLLAARMVNFIVGVLGAWGFYSLARLVRPGAERWALVFLAFSPYYLRDCSVLYVGNWAVVPTVWALYFYFRRSGGRDMVAAAALFGVATLCGQWALAVAFAALVAELGCAFTPQWRTTPTSLRAAAVRGGLVLLFQAPAAWIFVRWGALTAPRFSHAHGVVLAPGHAVGVLSVLGFVFVWWVVRRLGRIPPLRLAMLATLLPLILLGLPVVSQRQGLEQFTGLSARILQFAGARAGFDAPLLLVPAALFGLVLLYLTLRVGSVSDATIALSVALLFVAFSGSQIVGESHLRLLPPLVFLGVVSREPPDWTLRAVVVQSSLLGIAYAIYHGVFKFG